MLVERSTSRNLRKRKGISLHNVWRIDKGLLAASREAGKPFGGSELDKDLDRCFYRTGWHGRDRKGLKCAIRVITFFFDRTKKYQVYQALQRPGKVRAVDGNANTSQSKGSRLRDGCGPGRIEFGGSA
jgi:hypothetical protein